MTTSPVMHTCRERESVYEMNAFTHFCLLGPQLGGGQRLLWITLGGPEVQGYNQQGSMLGLTLDDAGGGPCDARDPT